MDDEHKIVIKKSDRKVTNCYLVNICGAICDLIYFPIQSA